MDPSTSSKRFKYIDVTKGIGILLVVLGHNDIVLVSPYLKLFIYSFHMPLFFFISGYFINVSTPFSQFLKKRFNSTLKPYFFTIFLIYAVSLSFSNMGFQRAIERIIKAFYGSTTYIDWTHLWFLPSLFVTSLFSYWVYRLGLSRLKSILLRWLILLGLLAVGVYSISYFFPFSITILGKDYELFGLPFNLDLLLVTSFFYILGNEVRQVSSEKIFSNIWLICPGTHSIGR
jgi:fucose 4-O-acetylase-like acetyltransferase